jgi:hypothetical protein
MFLPGDSAYVVFMTNVVPLLAIALLCLMVIALAPFLRDSYVVRKIKYILTAKTNQGQPPQYSVVKFDDIAVHFSWDLNGGGFVFAYEFVPVVAQKIGRVHHVFEYCAGPDFIGFALLANNLCHKLTLADVNPKAVEAVRETIRNNQLEDKVTVYQSNCLDQIPASEQWDLVVGYPPWLLSRRNQGDIRLYDRGCLVHEKFYRDIGKHLKPQGSVLFIEGGEYTKPGCFKDMIEHNGLRMIETFKAAPLFQIFKNIDRYQGTSFPFALFLRLMLFIREAYFIRSEKG